MINFSVKNLADFNYGYGNNLPIKEEIKGKQIKQITDTDYRNYSNAITAMNKSVVSFGADNKTTRLKSENAELREKIFKIDGYCFEKFAGYIFENALNEKGEKIFKNVTVTPPSGDNGVDIILDENDGTRTLVQCKHFTSGNFVTRTIMQELTDCREKDSFQKKDIEKLNIKDINCLIIASSGVYDSCIDYAKNQSFKYEIMNLDNLIDYAKEHKVEINDEVLKPFIEETGQRGKCHKDLLAQKNRIKEMINESEMTIDEIIQILNDEFKPKYPYIVKEGYISDFIKYTFNPPECFELLKQEGYKFEQKFGECKQNIFSVTKDGKTFIVNYIYNVKPLQNTEIERAVNNMLNASNDEFDGLILISANGFRESKDTYKNLKTLDKIYTVADNKLQEYNSDIPEKFKMIMNLLMQEGYKWGENLSVLSQNIFSAVKDNKTFIVNYRKDSSALPITEIDKILDSLQNAKKNENDGLILISQNGFSENGNTYKKLKTLDKIYTIADNKLKEYDGIPERLQFVVSLLKQEDYKWEANLNVNSQQNIFKVSKDDKNYIVYYKNCDCSPMMSRDIEKAINSMLNVKNDKNDGLILISKSGFSDSRDTYNKLKILDKIYTVNDNKLQKFDISITKRINTDFQKLLEQEGYKILECLSTNRSKNIFLVKKDNETFICYYSNSERSIANNEIEDIRKSITQAVKNENNKLILIVPNGFTESKNTYKNLKMFDKVYTVADNKLQEYTGIPKKLEPVIELLKQEGYDFKSNLGTTTPNIFSVTKDNKTFIVNYRDTNSAISNTEIDKVINNLLNAADDTSDGFILIAKSGFCESRDTYKKLKTLDKVYTVADNKLQEYTGIPERLKPIIEILKQNGYDWKENLSSHSGQNIFSVTKAAKTFIVNYSGGSDCMDSKEIVKAINFMKQIKNSEDENSGLILISKNGFRESRDNCKELKTLDKVYTVSDNKLKEYTDIPERLEPVIELLKQEGYEWKSNLNINNQNIFSVTQGKKTFIVNVCNFNRILYPCEIKKLQQSINKIEQLKDGVILITKLEIPACKKVFEEKTITDKNGNKYFVYIKNLTNEQKSQAA